LTIASRRLTVPPVDRGGDKDMTKPSPEREASDLLWSHWQAGTRLPALPEAIRPADRAAGYAIQKCLEQRSAKPLYGWKIAATSTAGQRHIGVDGPLAGRLLAERAFDDGAELRFGANAMRVVEAEFAFRMARNLAARDRDYTVDEVMDAAGNLHLAL
jgi:2-keto-4-pentenoate hydratase